MARKLRSKRRSKIYAQRKAIVEPVNGQIKECRDLRRFLLRGQEKVRASGTCSPPPTTCSSRRLLRCRRHLEGKE